MLTEADVSRSCGPVPTDLNKFMIERDLDLATRIAADSSRLSVVVVTHQSAACIERCLRSIESQRPAATEVLVVDSGSTDATADVVSRFAKARWIPAARNIGFAAAANLGVSAASGDLIAVLNADVTLRPGWNTAMLAAAGRHPAAASFASVQFLAVTGETLDGAGDALHCSGLAWRRGHGEQAVPRHDLDVFSACGAAAVYRRQPFVEVGGFEPTFFCYFEDVDLGFRLRLAGHACVCVADAVCDHEHGQSSGGSRSAFATYHGHRNMVWAFVRCMPAPLAWPLLPAFAAAQLACVAAGALRGQGRLVLRAKIDALRQLSRAMDQRRLVQRLRLAPAAAIANALSWTPLPRRGRSRGRDARRLRADARGMG